jgi:hypothetical protein
MVAVALFPERVLILTVVEERVAVPETTIGVSALKVQFCARAQGANKSNININTLFIDEQELVISGGADASSDVVGSGNQSR